MARRTLTIGMPTRINSRAAAWMAAWMLILLPLAGVSETLAAACQARLGCEMPLPPTAASCCATAAPIVPNEHCGEPDASCEAELSCPICRFCQSPYAPLSKAEKYVAAGPDLVAGVPAAMAVVWPVFVAEPASPEPPVLPPRFVCLNPLGSRGPPSMA